MIFYKKNDDEMIFNAMINDEISDLLKDLRYRAISCGCIESPRTDWLPKKHPNVSACTSIETLKVIFQSIRLFSLEIRYRLSLIGKAPNTEYILLTTTRTHPMLWVIMIM